MSHSVQYFLFIFTVLSVWILLHFYLSFRLIDPLTVGRSRLRWGGRGAILLLALISFLTVRSPESSAAVIVGHFWIGCVFFLAFLTSVRDILLAVSGGFGRFSPERRAFLKRSSAVGVAALGGAATSAGAVSALRELKVPRVTVSVPNLPRELDGLSIAHLSDLHIGNPFLGERFAQRTVELTNALKADLIAITGDLVEQPLSALTASLAPLSGLKAPLGVYYVTGNHEFYHGVTEWLPKLSELGLIDVSNRARSLSGMGLALDVGGLHDPTGYRFGAPFSPNADEIASHRTEGHPLLALAHQPVSINDTAALRPFLQLSGHTHGGQIWPFGALVMTQQPYLAGLYAHNNETQIYVSRGTGFWGPPIRIAAPAEIALLTLSRKS